MDIVDLNELNDLMYLCFIDLNNIISLSSENEIASSLCIKSSKKTSFYEFLKFKESVENYRFELELFYKNREWNLKKQLNRKILSDITEWRTYAETALKDLNNFLSNTKYLEFKEQLTITVKTLVSSVNGYLSVIRRYLKRNVSDKEYQNLTKLYNLDDLKY